MRTCRTTGVVFELLRTDKEKKVAIKFAKAWKLVGGERNPQISAQFAALHAEFQTVRLISGAHTLCVNVCADGAWVVAEKLPSC